ncbi:T6SS effector BTH_I2691 family protein [Achromobacter pestifer]|uniref:Toxin VasX N-terminal region domain-containing protein n=1 Tax=Achromobacter pestifer TaxID=1353889 RepID=A0A6S6YXK4_9BURK|nr:T6SS effector BTH_I2691 family protein [Achromobacter pestifer]CAB3649695.1 hypothetical protein LMG3431_02764 [Achromobacter pestifer]
MADDPKNCGKKRSSLNCEEDCPFHRVGLPIMPLRYAVLPNNDMFAPLTGDFEGIELVDKPLGQGARYGVRLLRTGYLYVYDEARRELKGYYVNENATLYNFDLDKPVEACDRAFTCTMDHEARASLLTIPNARRATFVWLAFSDVQWTKDVCKAHKGKSGAALRERHMFKFDVQAWLNSKQHPNAKRINTLKDTVADYVVERKRDLSHSEKNQLTGWSTVNYMDVKGWMGGMIEEAAEAFSPGNGLMLALPDGTGVLQDLARLMRHRFDEFVSNRSDIRQLTVSKSIESLREIVMQSAETRFLNRRATDATNQSVYGTTTPNMMGTGGGGAALGQQLADLLIDGHREQREAEADRYRYPTEQERWTVKWEEWKDYLDAYDEKARADWQKEFDGRLGKFDQEVIVPMAKAHVAWMTCDHTVSSFRCNYDVKNVDSGEVFQTVFSLCIDGTQDKRACFDLYTQWLQGAPVDTGNLLLRAMVHNQDLVAEKVVEAHDAIVDWKAVPWGNLHETYKTALQSLGKGRLDKTARLMEQLMGPIVGLLRLGVDHQMARKIALLLGIVTEKPVVIVDVVGSKKAFRAALIREVLRQHGSQVNVRQMERAVSDELRRLEVKGERLDGTDKKQWFMVVDREAASSVPTDLRGNEQARRLAQSTMTIEEYEAREMSRWRTAINTDVRVGAVSCLFQAVTLYKLWSDLDTAMLHERKDASWKFVVGIAGAGGSFAEVLGVALKAQGAAGMRLGAGIGLESTGALLARWGGRVGVVTGVIMAIFDFKSGAQQITVERNGLMGGLYIASGIFSLVLIAAFAMSSTIVGIVFAVALIIVAILIEYFKDDKIKEWLKRCLWGKFQGQSGTDYYYGLQDEMNNLRLALGGD